MKKTKKIIFSILVLLFVSLSLFAEDSPKTFFPSLASNPVFPTDKDLGLISSEESSEEHKFLALALKQEYSFDWVEQNVSPKSKSIITSLYSKQLSTLLPATSFLMSKMYKNADNSASITVKFTQSSDILTFVILENKIINVTVVKK